MEVMRSCLRLFWLKRFARIPSFPSFGSPGSLTLFGRLRAPPLTQSTSCRAFYSTTCSHANNAANRPSTGLCCTRLTHKSRSRRRTRTIGLLIAASFEKKNVLSATVKQGRRKIHRHHQFRLWSTCATMRPPTANTIGRPLCLACTLYNGVPDPLTGSSDWYLFRRPLVRRGVDL
jgi:hypothetical protein